MRRKRRNKVLCILTAVCLMATTVLFLQPEESYGADSSQPRYLAGIEVNVTVKDEKRYTEHEEQEEHKENGGYNGKFYTKIKENYAKKYNTEKQALQISTAGELAAFAKRVNIQGEENLDFNGKYVKLMADIDLNGTAPQVSEINSDEEPLDKEELSKENFMVVIDNPKGNSDSLSNVWDPIGKGHTAFKGTFDGGGHKIKNMVICEREQNTPQYVGFFGHVEGGTIKNLGIEDASVIAQGTDKTYVGSLVGYLHYGSHIQNSYANGRANGCAVYAHTTATDADVEAGSLVGGTEVTQAHEQSQACSITDSYGSGKVYASGMRSHAGGLVGSNYGSLQQPGGNPHDKESQDNPRVLSEIERCYGSGEVYALARLPEDYKGELGTPDEDTPDLCATAGGLVGYNNVKGIIADSYGSGSAFAYMRDAALSTNYNYARAGGLVGYNASEIKSSYGMGDVHARSVSTIWCQEEKVEAVAVGGLVGYAHSTDGTTENSYRNSEARVTGRTKRGNVTPGGYGVPLTRQEMTGTGTGRASETMNQLPQDTWTFEADGDITKEGTRYYRTCYFPRLKNKTPKDQNPISYTEASKPQYRKEVYALDSCIQVKITGEVSEGNVLSAVVTPKAGSPAEVKNPTYQWYVGGSPVSGADNPTYSVAKGDVGKTITAAVTHEDFYGSVTATANQLAKLAKPSLTTSTTYKSVKLSWKSVKEAKGYQVYRAAKKNGSYKKVKTTKSKSWTNKNLTTGKAYYYKVRAYKKQGNKTIYGSFSKTVKAVPRTKAPAFKLIAGNNKMKIKWKKAGGADGYKIYRARSKNGKYKMVKDSRSRLRTYTSIRLTDHHTYYYKMRSYRVVKGKKVYSAYSGVKSKRTK